MRTWPRLLVLLALAALVGGCESNAPWRPLYSSYPEAGYEATPFPYRAEDSGALDRDHLEPGNAAWVADLFVYFPYGIMFVIAGFMVWRHRTRAVAEQASSPTAPLRDGPAVVIGTVAADPAWLEPFVRVDIHQAGTEWSNKGNWSYRWTETSRAVNHRPFVIRRDDGVEVRVEPDAKVAIHDDHGRIVRHAFGQRTRFAEITVGERVYVSGDLVGASLAASAGGGAYRAPTGTPAVRPPPMGRMLISTEAPGATSTARMRFHLKWMTALAATFLFVSTAVMPLYQSLSLSYDAVSARPVATRNWREWRKPKNSSGYWVYYWSVRGVYNAHGREITVQDEVGQTTHDCVTSGQCPRVPFVVSTINPAWHQFGVAPTLTVGRAVILALLCILLLILYPVTTVSTRPWYMKKKVVDTGSGRLADSKP